MNLEELRNKDNDSLLKYLAYLQICPENSSNLQTLQALQNMVLKGECITSDDSLWYGLNDHQSGLFVENYICYSACQFRAFVSDATDRPWQICLLIDNAIKYKMFSRKDFYTVFFFLGLSDKIAERLGLDYYVLGNYSDSKIIDLLDIDEKQMNCLSFSIDELKAIGHSFVEISILDEYCSERGHIIELKPVLKSNDSYFILSPNALMNCAWRELLKVLKKTMTDIAISKMFGAIIAEEIHNNMPKTWIINEKLSFHTDSYYSVVYMVYHHRYYIVSVVTKQLKAINIEVIEPLECDDILDVSFYLDMMSKKVKDCDKEAEIVHIVIPVTMQNELALVSSNVPTPVILILWQPLRTLLMRDDDNASWLYYYALDRKNSKSIIFPDVNEEDVIAIYLMHKHSFYFTDPSIDYKIADIEPGFSLPLLYDIKRRANVHAIVDADTNIVVERGQDGLDGIPFYEKSISDYDLMVGEFLASNMFLRLPKNAKDEFPEIHAVGRSLIMWYYALEKYMSKPILGSNFKIYIEKNDNLDEGFVLREDVISTLVVGQNLLGLIDGHNVERKLLETVIADAAKKGFVIYNEYNNIIEHVFSSCPGGLIQRLPESDLLCDYNIGERHYYIVDVRRKSLVVDELADKFGKFPVGSLSIEQSKSLVNEMIHYLNDRVITILEQFDLEKFLLSMMKIRDGVLFWHKTMTLRYDAMVSFYRYLGTDDPIQEKRIHEFVETDLCTRCLVEYALIKCSHHGNKDIAMDINTVEDMFALMSGLINMGYLSDFYRSPTYKEVIEVLPNKRFAFPIYNNNGLSKYAKLTTRDRLEHPNIYEKLYNMVEKIDYSEYEEVFKSVFISEFGVDYDDFIAITSAIIKLMQENKRDIWLEEINSFKKTLSIEAQVNNNVMTSYVASFSISADYHDLSLFPMFHEYDTYPCRYKRKLGLIYKPICVFESKGCKKVSFSYRGFIQSQYNLLDNIRMSNYSKMSEVMGKYMGSLNGKRGKIFENGVFELYKNQKGLICHRSAKIGPKEKLQNKDKSLGDIDVLLIDNKLRRILLIEAKNYNECKTPYEAVDFERKLIDNQQKAVTRDIWAKANKTMFGWYAKMITCDYKVASVMLTYNLNPSKFINDNYKADLPIVWIRDVIENPMKIFEYGDYA